MRGQFRAARLARQDLDATGEQLQNLVLQLQSGVSDCGSDYVSVSDSDGASVGATTPTV